MTRYEQLKTALAESQSWYTHKQLCETLGVASSDCSVILKQLEQEGAAQRVKPPKDFARGAQWIFAAAGVEPPEGAGLLPKMKGFKAEARAAKRAKKGKPVPVITAPTKGALESRFCKGAAPLSGAPRWAFTSDGTFALMGEGIELTIDQVKALDQFARGLAEGTL